MGAFVTAAAQCRPVIPIVIKGTRSMLRAESWLPRRGLVEITICAPLQPDGREWADALSLRDASRGVMLERLGEPDLAASDSA